MTVHTLHVSTLSARPGYRPISTLHDARYERLVNGWPAANYIQSMIDSGAAVPGDSFELRNSLRLVGTIAIARAEVLPTVEAPVVEEAPAPAPKAKAKKGK